MSSSVDPDETAHMSRLIWIYAVCKRLLLSPVAVKELNTHTPYLLACLSYCPFDISRKDVFAWRFILNEYILF